jgi:hypothetical protein
MLLHWWPIVGTSSTFRKVPYHSRDDAQEAHGASDLKLPVAQVLSPIPGVPSWPMDDEMKAAR